MPYCSVKCSRTYCGHQFVVYEYSASFRAHGDTGVITCPSCQQIIPGDAAKTYITDIWPRPASSLDGDQVDCEVFG